jgi:plastocyanin
MHIFKLTTVAATLSVAMALPAFAADHAVTIENFKFDPPSLEVAAGDTVTFTNKDSAPHTATANDKSFDTGKLGQGESGTITIADAGSFDYICTFHPMMKGNITAK